MKVIVASKNPVKIRAVEHAFQQVFPDTPISVSPVEIDSGVSDQPSTDAETLKGAINRAQAARSKIPNADYWLGLEGGIHQQQNQLNSFAWIAIANKDSLSTSRTASFPLPTNVSKLIDQGLELGDAMADLHSKPNVKQKEGAVGILTHGLITRTQLYIPAVVLGLIPFANPSEFELVKV